MPASGKDTLTNLLCNKNTKYVALKKYRSVDDNTPIKTTYYNISTEEFEKKIANGDFLQYHQRYNRYYGIEKSTLMQILNKNQIPIIHIGRIENFFVFKQNIEKLAEQEKLTINIIHILLWNTIDVLSERIKQRDKTYDEIKRRIDATVEEFKDNILLFNKEVYPYTCIIKNTDINNTLKYIDMIVDNEQSSDNGYKEFINYVKNTKFE